MEPADTLILGPLVVTMGAEERILDTGAVAVRDGEIVAVGTREELEGCEAAETIDATGRLLMPGLVNAHTHLGDSLFRGLVEELPLEAWLERLWISEREFVSRESVELGARLSIVEMIRSGTTCALDMFWFPEAAADAAVGAGFRLVTGPIFFDFDGPDGVSVEERVATGERWLERYAQEPLVTPCVQPHNQLTVSPEGLRAARDLADRAGALFHTHCSETATEVRQTVERFGRTPAAHFHELGILDERTVLAHCVHLSDDDFARIRRAGAAVLHNPLSNLKLGSGIAPVARMLEEDIPVALGTDGPVSSNDLDMWTAMRFAGLLQRGAHMDPVLTPARDIVRMATTIGAEALGLGDRVGRLAEGYRADLILIDLDRPHLTPMYDVYGHLVYTVGRDDIRSVMVDGRWVMRDRGLETIDEAAVLADMTDLASVIDRHAAALDRA
ncbi:amidohydrolase [Candidatus Palauibacter soopunensis]|uniref:amidohydrolase n=1 Tax=Candidatus Palauibacter soopunensis TaxID=3056739 RepID=UPI0023A6DC08|nr:amidohydrolase [Candidatus Palauibacter soopunensis]MDE2879093.1 amidohydrolase [Candidatus Palauibacter soopunensis]